MAYFTQAGLSAEESGERNLAMVVDFLNRGEEPAERVARRHGRSRQALYQAAARARVALAPKRPGTKPREREVARLEAENAALRAESQAAAVEVATLRTRLQSTVVVDAHRRKRLELACFGQHVSLRGTCELLDVAFGREHRPRLEDVQQRMKAHGVVARGLIDDARAEVRDSVHCIAADDVFFHDQDVKVMIEPESGTVLDARHSAGSSGAHWAERLAEFPNLQLLVSDLGSDLCGAARLRGVAHQADYFHEVRYLEDAIDELSKHEDGLRRQAATEGLYARNCAEQAEAAEAAFFELADAIEWVHAVYQPVHPKTGRLWTPAEARTVLERTIDRLNACRQVTTRRVARHLKTHLNRYLGHLVTFGEIEVTLRPDASWPRDAVLNGILRRRLLDRDLKDPTTWSGYQAYLDRLRLVRELERRLHANCANVDAVSEQLLRALARPRRSSSGVESVNSRLRVLQMAHRRVSDEMLALTVLRLNLTPRRDLGGGQVRSHYESLGIVIGQDGKRWYDVLLDAESALGLVA